MKECKDCNKSENIGGIHVCGSSKPHLCEHIEKSDKKTVIAVIGAGEDMVSLAKQVMESEIHTDHNLIITNQHIPSARPMPNIELEQVYAYKNYHIPDNINFLFDKKHTKHKNRDKNTWENPNKYHN